MAPEDATKRRIGCGRLLIYGLVFLLATAAVAGFLLYRGIPQRWGVQYLLTSQLNADAAVRSVSLRSPLTVQGLTLADKASQVYGPPVKAETISVAYTVQPDDGRYLDAVSLEGVQLSLQQGAGGSNFSFLLDSFATGGNGGGDVSPWIPERVSVSDLWLELNFPSYYLRMDKLGIDASLASASEGTLALSTSEAGISWSSVYTPGDRRSSAGTLAFDAAWDPAGVELDAAVDLGPLAKVQAMGSLLYRDGQPYYALSIPEASLEDPLWSAMLTDLSPVPVRFDRLTIADSDIHIHQGEAGIVIDQAALDARAPAISIGPEEAPYYSGPFAAAVRGNYGETTEITGTLTVLDGLALEGAVHTSETGMGGRFAWEPWPRDALLQLIPTDYGVALDTLKPLQRLGATGTFAYTADALTVEASLAGDFNTDAPLSAPLHLSKAKGGPLVLETEVDLHGGSVETTVTVPPDEPVTIQNALTSVRINPWTAYLLGNEMVPWFSGEISGTVGISLPPGSPLELALNLTGAGLRYGDIVLPEEAPVIMTGRMIYDLNARRLASQSAELTQEGLIDLTASSWSFDLDTTVMELDAKEATLSLDAVASLFGLSELYGNTVLSGQLRVGPEETRLTSLLAESEDLMYGDYSVPYGSKLVVNGGLVYAREPNTLRFEPVTATLGEATRLQAALVAMNFPGDEKPLTLEAKSITLDTDMDFLVNRGTLGGVSGGALRVHSDDFRWEGEEYAGIVAWDISAQELTLPDDMATLEDVAWSGRYNPGDTEDGGGPLTVSAFSVYKIPFGAADTTLKVTPNYLRCDSFETTFLGGNLQLSGRVDYNDPAFPGTVKVSAENLDLEEFTQVFEPPDVVLTGKVSGTGDMKLSMEGLQDLNLNLTASDGLSLNRSMVRQILMSQYVNDAVGNKSVQKVIEKVIGKDEQRPFESAVLELRLEDGLIRGVAKLSSEALDVTVDINAEPKAILEAIRSTAGG